MHIPLFVLMILLAFLFLLFPAFRLRKRLIEEKKETFTVIDGSTFWSSRWGKVTVYGVESPQEGAPGYKEAKQFLSHILSSARIEIIPIKKDREGEIVARVLADGEDLAARLREIASGQKV